MLWVKICGMTNPEDALAAADAGADAIGMLFAPSKRRVTTEQAKAITDRLPHTLERVGVFYNEDAQNIEEIATAVNLTAVQLHGDESPEFARQLFRNNPRRNRSRMRVFKTLHVVDGVETIARYFLNDSAIDGFLLDAVIQNRETGESERGGTGTAFDWNKMAGFVTSLQRDMRVIVAGGLSPDNVGDAIKLMQPWGVDVCSGVESMPGKKDPAKIHDFVAAARDARN